MYSLSDVQSEVTHQLIRDYKDTSEESVQSLIILGLTEEAGEVAGLMKRQLRNNFRDTGTFTRERYVEELGDVLWYLTACCYCVGTSLEEIWQQNIIKLEKRYGK